MRDAAAGVLGLLKAKGEEVFAQVSSELMSNPRFMQAMQTAFKGKAKLDEAVAQALRTANIPTRTEFKRAVRRVEALEAQVEELKAALAAAAQPKPKRRAPRRKAASAKVPAE
jgi:polyhydroxyalkanoate synthesis regulator phasin